MVEETAGFHAWHDDASHGSKWTFAGVAPMPFGQRA